MAISPLDAVMTRLKNYPNLLAFLPNGSADVLPTGRATGATNKAPGASVSPFLTVSEWQLRGHPNTPHIINTIRVRVYSGDTSGQAQTPLITKILYEVKKALHKFDAGQIDNMGFMDCRWSGYQSATLYDFALRMYFQEIRFDLYLAQSL